MLMLKTVQVQTKQPYSLIYTIAVGWPVFCFFFRNILIYSKLHEILIEVQKIYNFESTTIFYRKLDKHEFRFKKYFFFFVRMLAGYHIVCIDMTQHIFYRMKKVLFHYLPGVTLCVTPILKMDLIPNELQYINSSQLVVVDDIML